MKDSKPVGYWLTGNSEAEPCIFALHMHVDCKTVHVELIRFSTFRKIVFCKEDWLLTYTHTYGLFNVAHSPLIHYVVCLTTGLYLLPMRVLHRMRSSASSLNIRYHLLSSRSFSSCLCLLLRLPVTYIHPSVSFNNVF